MSFKIYTKTGDKGKTSLIGGTKVLKSDLRIESYGTVDELNSYIGLICELLQDEESVKMLREIQDRLFTIGSALACDPEKDSLMRIPDLHSEDVQLLETEIDRMEKHLEPMKSFILPGGHATVAHIHIARCVCRRGERGCVRLQETDPEMEGLIIIYMNRLSDYLFVLSRYAAHLLHAPEIPWNPRIN